MRLLRVLIQPCRSSIFEALALTVSSPGAEPVLISGRVPFSRSATASAIAGSRSSYDIVQGYAVVRSRMAVIALVEPKRSNPGAV